MAQVATRVLPFTPTRTMPGAEAPVGESVRGARVLGQPAPIPPDLEVACGILNGVVVGLLVWAGLLLPALYFLL